MEISNAIVVDDQKMVSESLKILLKKVGRFSLISNYYTVEDAEKEMSQRKYDYLFSDLRMPGVDVKEFLISARRNFPELMIIVISSETDILAVKDLFTVGINAYLSKSVGSDELKNAIDKINMGERYISSDIASKLVHTVFDEEKEKLSKREIEILQFVAAGKSIIETADAMHLSHHTIIAHRRNIMDKLGLHSATEMVKYAYENNIAKPV